MSTRSFIAIELPANSKHKSKNIKAIYVHSDGYPDGVGHTLLSYYNNYDKAYKLFEYGDCSSLGETLEDCSFYSRDWNRKEDPAKIYNNEYSFLSELSGDVFIEFVYLFKNNKWYVATSKSIKAPKDHWDEIIMNGKIESSRLYYLTKFILINKHPNYNPSKRNPNQMSEKQMIGQIGEMLSKTFGKENMIVQGQKPNKKTH